MVGSLLLAVRLMPLHASRTNQWICDRCLLQTLPAAAHIPAIRSDHHADAMLATHLHWLHRGTVLPLYELMDS
jgi:hypothetical protein